jgi:hypothetical protein
MKYMTASEAAKKWNISDRRVRTLCSEGKIAGALKQGKSYRIPVCALKPIDGRLRIPDAARYLKWDDDVIGSIDQSNAVFFIRPDYNEVLTAYTHGAKSWTSEQFAEFLMGRIVSRDRRDIEKILFRLGLSHYNPIQIGEITRAINPADLIWIADGKDDRLEGAMTNVFESVFNKHIDLAGDSIDTPEGYNIKRYGVYNGRYGIYKQRISPLVTDVESEVAVYLIAERLGVPCCPAFRTDNDTVFSTFLYDFAHEYIVHFRRLFDGGRSDNEYQNLIGVRPQYKDDIARMILLDFITRQDDRHLSNIAIKISASDSETQGDHRDNESFYPLYDNGRSLFYEDTPDTVSRAAANPLGYATTFGYSGTYLDYVREISTERSGLGGLIRTDISKAEIKDILIQARFTDYRLDGALEWIVKTLEIVSNV